MTSLRLTGFVPLILVLFVVAQFCGVEAEEDVLSGMSEKRHQPNWKKINDRASEGDLSSVLRVRRDSFRKDE